MDTLDRYARQPVVSSSNVRWTRKATAFVMGMLGISYMFNAMDRQVFRALLGGIRATYGLTLPQAGFAGTVFAINVALFGTVRGWFLSGFTRKSILMDSPAGYSLFTLLTPLAQRFVNLAFYRSLIGVGEALQIGTICARMGSYFGRNRGAAMGVVQAFFGLGAFVGPIAGARLRETLGAWQTPLYAFGIGGLIIAAAVAVFLPVGFPEAREDSNKQAGSARMDWRPVLNRNV